MRVEIHTLEEFQQELMAGNPVYKETVRFCRLTQEVKDGPWQKVAVCATALLYDPPEFILEYFEELGEEDSRGEKELTDKSDRIRDLLENTCNELKLRLAPGKFEVV